ncbi:MAG: hypothetical protein K0S14_1411 [Thermomicrobiales bacterium]|nr:hypothetical protein [Thermomicrobiales bacterium]
MRGVRSLLTQTRPGATPNADGAANADGERVKAPTLSAFGYLARVTATEIQYFGCSRMTRRSAAQEGRDVHRDWYRGRHHLDSHLAACLGGLLTPISAPVMQDGGGTGPLERDNLPGGV